MLYIHSSAVFFKMEMSVIIRGVGFSIGVSWGLSERFSLRNGIGGYRKSWQVLEQSVKSSILVVGYQTRFPPNGGGGENIFIRYSLFS